MKKANKLYVMGLFLLVVIVCLIVYFIQYTRPLELNGSEEMVVEINETFDDPGTNIKNVKIEGQVDTTHEGDYVLTYEYHGKSVSRTVYVRDFSRLVINLNGSQDTYVLKDEPYIESSCHIIDTQTGHEITEIDIDGTVDTSVAGDYQITYTAKYDHMQVSKTRNVHVVESLDKNTKGIPVLMYHYVYTKDDVPESLSTNYILDTDLQQQLQYLVDNHYYFPSYEELQAYINGEISLPEKSVILTFDDAQSGFLKYGIPLLEEYQIPATSFVIGIKNGEEKVKEYASEYVSFQSHSYDMHKAGGNIGHGGIISALNQDEIVEDLKKNQTIVQNDEAFAYPYGDYTDDAIAAIKETSIICAFTTEYGRVKEGMDYTCLPRIRVLGGYPLSTFINSIN